MIPAKNGISMGVHSGPNMSVSMFSPFQSSHPLLPSPAQQIQPKEYTPSSQSLQGSGNKSVEVNRTAIKPFSTLRSHQHRILNNHSLSTPLPSGGKIGSVGQCETLQVSVHQTPVWSLAYLSFLCSSGLQIQTGPSRPQWCPVEKRKPCVHRSIYEGLPGVNTVMFRTPAPKLYSHLPFLRVEVSFIHF